MMFAWWAVRATAAIHSPRAKRAAAVSTSVSTKPGSSLGKVTPQATTATMSISTTAAAAMARLMTSCAPSSQDGDTRVVERRRSTPCSR